ncbi:MAG: CBS domain-containing protein, partial [Planctomycetota bacterium]
CMAFDDARGNFMAASRYGLKATLAWRNGKEYRADTLILDHLLPLAHSGLERQGIDSSDRDSYLGVLEERVRSGRTGAQWALDSLSAMDGKGTVGGRMRAVCDSIHDQQWNGEPVHTWDLAELSEKDNWLSDYRTVGQIMTTDLFTVHPDDLIDLAASVMEWEHLRHVPVEDSAGELVGILSHRAILRLVARGKASANPGEMSVSDVMQESPITATAQTLSLDAIYLMREHGVACLPVVDEAGKLRGIVTEHDFIAVAARLLEEKLREA